ncbi:alpha 1,2 mannosyltransferase [Mucor circinelloides]
MLSKVTLLSIFLLLWLRWLTATLPGYIHPDEFFQNPEITSAKIFNIHTLTPWEYQPQHASRSILSPFLTTGIPFYMLKAWLPKDTLPSSVTLFMTERLSAFVWTLVIDVCVYRICKHIGTKPKIPMLLIATSQVTLAYNTRPFSNSFESVLLCLCLYTYVNYAHKANARLAFLLGALFSVGVFTRITFPLYAFPIGIAFIYQAYKQSYNFNQFTTSVFPLVLGIISFAVFAIVADSVYYGTLSFTVDGQPFRDVGHVVSTLFDPTTLATVRADGDIVITPLNNLLYNMNVDNLAQHGLHPRYTHFAVNLPLLFGPLAVFGFLYMPNVIAKVQNDDHTHLLYVLISVVFSGLVGLSIIPHQEARFLTPLLAPLILIYTWKQVKLPASFWVIWLLFNVITTYIFAVVHQGGIVPTMGFLQRQTTGIHDCHVLQNGDLTCTVGANNATDTSGFHVTTNLVFYKTYMPPRHLLVDSKNSRHTHINILDFSSRLDEAVAALENSSGVVLRRHQPGKIEIDFAKTSAPNSFERTIFISPSFVPLPKVKNHRYLMMASYSPHVGFDDMDKMMERAAEMNSPESQMSLNVFLLLSDQDDPK